MKIKTLILCFAVFALAAMPAAAAPIVLDFASNTYAGANGADSFGVVDQGIAVSLSAPNALQTLEWVLGEGIGIDGLVGDDGEIGNLGLELLVSALGPPPLTVLSFEVAQLFPNELGSNEQGEYSVDGGVSWTSFTGTNASGLLTVNVPVGPNNDNNLVNIRFRSSQSGSTGQLLVSDYSLKSITVAPIPEPASMFLLGSGLLGAGALRRRKQQQKKTS